MRFEVGDLVRVVSSSDSRDDRIGWLARIRKALPCALWQLPEYYIIDFYYDDGYPLESIGHYYGHELAEVD